MVAGVVAATGAVLWLTMVFGPSPRVAPPDLQELAPRARSAADFARLSCVHVGLANQAIQADAAARTVRIELAAARVLASEALRRDGRYAALSGGVAAVDESIRNDDGDAAAIALPVVVEQCEDLPEGAP